MTNKCKRRMNGREKYITTEITQRKGGGRRPRRRGRPRERKEAPVWPRGVGDSRPRARGPFSLGHWAALFCVCFHPQNKSSPYQSPTFGPTLYKFIVLGLVQKPRPYNWCRLWESCLCDDECGSLLRQGQTPKGRQWWPICWAASGELPGGS